MTDLNKDILSIEHIDDNDDYDGFVEYLNTNTEREKQNIINQVIINSESFLNEIDRKKDLHNEEKIPFIKYILSHTKKYDRQELESYELKYVKEIYDSLKKNSFISKLFNFLFNQK